MGQVTDINQVKADLAGRSITRLALTTSILEGMSKLYHNAAHKKLFYRPNFEICKHKECMDARYLIYNTRQMISQGI